MLKKIFVFFKLIVSIGLLWYLFSLINFGQFLEQISNVKRWPLLLVVLIYFPAVYISVLRWSNILSYYRVIFSKFQLFNLYLIGGFFNNFLPTSVGGDTYKFIYMNKIYPRLSKEILSSIIIERGFGFLSLFIVNIILFFCLQNFIFSNAVFSTVELIIVFIFIFLVFFIIFKNRATIYLEKIKISFGLFVRFKKFLKVLVSINDKKSIIISFIYSIFFIAVGSFSIFLLFYSLGYDLNIFYILLVYSTVNIFSVLPISLNSFGISEGLYVFLFGIYGVEYEVSLAVAIMSRILLILASSSGGIIYLLGNFKDVLKQSKNGIENNIKQSF